MHKLFSGLAALSFFALASLAIPAYGQTSNCVVSSSAPTYVAGQVKPLSCETDGDLRVVTGGGASTTDVNIVEVGGNAVTTTVPVSGTVTAVGNVASVSADSGNPLKIGAVYNTTAPAPTAGQRVDLQTGTGGELIAVPRTLTTASADGISNASSAQVSGFSLAGVANVPYQRVWNLLFNGTTWDRMRGDTTGAYAVQVPATTQADTLMHSVVLANSTNSTNVKASAGTLYNVQVGNNSANIAYLKLYNSASAPTCGSGTPVARYIIPGAASGGAGSNIDIAVGSEFTTGIGYCVTGLIADSDTTAVAASAFLVNLTYK